MVQKGGDNSAGASKVMWTTTTTTPVGQEESEFEIICSVVNIETEDDSTGDHASETDNSAVPDTTEVQAHVLRFHAAQHIKYGSWHIPVMYQAWCGTVFLKKRNVRGSLGTTLRVYF